MSCGFFFGLRQTNASRAQRKQYDNTMSQQRTNTYELNTESKIVRTVTNDAVIFNDWHECDEISGERELIFY